VSTQRGDQPRNIIAAARRLSVIKLPPCHAVSVENSRAGESKDLLPGSAVEDIGRSRKIGYKPSAADGPEFQLALQQEVAKLGY
jgi:hypothetical protein